MELALSGYPPNPVTVLQNMLFRAVTSFYARAEVPCVTLRNKKKLGAAWLMSPHHTDTVNPAEDDVVSMSTPLVLPSHARKLASICCEMVLH